MKKVFTKDKDDSTVSDVEMTFLHRRVLSANPIAMFWDWPKQEDKEVVCANRCFYGPATPTLEQTGRGKSSFKFSCKEQVSRKFNLVAKYGL